MTHNTTRNDERSTALKFLIGVSAVLALSVLLTGAAASQPSNPLDDNESGPDEEHLQSVESDLGDLRIYNTEKVGEQTGEITVQWRGETPETLHHTQIAKHSDSITMEQARLYPNETVVVEVALVSNDPSLIYTEQSLENKRGERVSWTNNEQREVTLFQAFWMGGSVFLAGTALAAFRKVNVYGKIKSGWS